MIKNDMIQIDIKLADQLMEQAKSNPRFRQNYDLRTSLDDGGQRMLNALLPETNVPIHRHPMSNEVVVLLSGKIEEILFDESGKEVERVLLNPASGSFGCVVPQGTWHTVNVLEPSVMLEAKDGQYGKDGSETYEEAIAKNM